MKKNAGLSLVELTVVVSIMAILVGLVSIGVNAIFGMDAKQSASDLNAYLKETKTETLSKDYQELKLYKDSNGEGYVDFVVYHYQEDPLNPGVVLNDLVPEISKTIKISKEKVSIRCTFSDGSLLELQPSMGSVTLAFNRASGAFSYVKINDIETSIYCTKIELSRGNKTYTISCIPTTGKHYIN